MENTNKKIKKLQLNKEVISKLNNSNFIQGNGISAGCTDGCTTIKTWWNCTKANCTADCGTNFCDTKAFCTHLK